MTHWSHGLRWLRHRFIRQKMLLYVHHSQHLCRTERHSCFFQNNMLKVVAFTEKHSICCSSSSSSQTSRMCVRAWRDVTSCGRCTSQGIPFSRRPDGGKNGLLHVNKQMHHCLIWKCDAAWVCWDGRSPPALLQMLHSFKSWENRYKESRPEIPGTRVSPSFTPSFLCCVHTSAAVKWRNGRFARLAPAASTFQRDTGLPVHFPGSAPWSVSALRLPRREGPVIPAILTQQKNQLCFQCQFALSINIISQRCLDSCSWFILNTPSPFALIFPSCNDRWLPLSAV